MKCSTCGADMGAIEAFPGSEIPCAACGTRSVVGLGPKVASTPYRVATPTVGGVRSSPSDLRCPRCSLMLKDDVLGPTCSQCKGVFIDHGALAALVAEADSNRTPGPFTRLKPFDPDVRSFPCPTCRMDMDRSAFGQRSGIFVDACHEHGTWFDVGELDDALRFVRVVGLDAVRAAQDKPVPPPHAPPVDDVRHAQADLAVELLSEELRERKAVDRIIGKRADILSFILGRWR